MSATSPRTIEARTDDALTGRTAAAMAVEAALGRHTFAMDVIRSLRRAGRLDAREAGLATQIAMGTLRHLRTIRYLLGRVGRFDPNRTPARVQAILCGAAYQAIWMDRVPMFAAVSEAVDLARALDSAGAARMVNALLRRLGAAIADRRTEWRGGDARLIRVSWATACAFDREIAGAAASADPDELLAVLTGETTERIRLLRLRHGQSAAAEAAWASQALPALVVQRNPLRASADDFRSAAVAAGAELENCTDDAAYISSDAFQADAAVLRDGCGYVQDATAAAASRLVAAQPGERVLDLCAAPGGKTLALAIDMQDRGEVVACDVDAARLARVAENAIRLGLKCVRAAPVGPDDELPSMCKSFDAALLDVPCSNTGVIARRPEARFGLTAKKLASLVALQSDLLRRGAACVRPGGRLVYSTCSIEPDENEQVLQAFLARCSGWRLETSHTTLPRWGPRPSDWRDGGFAARMTRVS